MSQIALYAFFMPGIQEGLIVLAIGFLLFGAQRLPKIAHSIGSSFIQLKKGLSGIEDEISSVEDSVNDIKTDINKKIKE